jgi:Replication-relaxation
MNGPREHGRDVQRDLRRTQDSPRQTHDQKALFTGSSSHRSSTRPDQRPDRDHDVLTSVAMYRIITATQLQRLHFPASAFATPATATRLGRRSFERMVRANLLVRLERRIGGSRAGSASYCYALGDAGLTQLGLPRSRRREPSAPFVNHVLAVAEIAVRLHEAARLDEQLSITHLQTEIECWRTFMARGSETETLKPDLAVQLRIAEVGNTGYDELHWFVELDRGTEHRPAIEKKLRTYIRYYQTGIEQQQHEVFPQVLWSVDAGNKTAERVDRLKSYIERTLTGTNAPKQLFVVQPFEETINQLKGGQT